MIGKQFKFKLLENTAARTVVDKRNGFIIFDDDSRVEEDRLVGLFEEVTSSTPPNIRGGNNGGGIAQNTIAPVAAQDDEVVNPATFFDDANIVNRISQQATKIDTSVLANMGEQNVSRTVESTIAHDVEQHPEEVRKIEAKRKDFSKADADFAGYDKHGNPVNPGMHATESTNAPQGFPLLQQMKRSKKVKLKINIEDSIPKPDFIKMMDENFDGGVLDYLVTDIVSKLLKSPQQIEKQVRDALEEIVYDKKKSTRQPRRKTATPKPNEKSVTNDIPPKTTDVKEGISEEDK